MAVKYPDPFVVEPKERHENTFIFLHGTSQDGEAFGDAFLNFAIPAVDDEGGLKGENKTLPQLFPSTRFVFPTGKKRFSTVLGKESHAWFDFESFSDRTQNEELQIPGLAESSEYLGKLVDAEVALILEGSPVEGEGEDADGDRAKEARRRIVVGGFSQGSAMACIALLAGKLGVDIGAFVGLSGWCPFRVQILDAISKAGKTIDGKVTGAEKLLFAEQYLRELLGLDVADDEQRLEYKRMPVFLGHGANDEKMKVHWGREMGALFEQMGFDVRFKAYGALEHWWNVEEIEDLVGFLRHLGAEKNEGETNS